MSAAKTMERGKVTKKEEATAYLLDEEENKYFKPSQQRKLKKYLIPIVFAVLIGFICVRFVYLGKSRASLKGAEVINIDNKKLDANKKIDAKSKKRDDGTGTIHSHDARDFKISDAKLNIDLSKMKPLKKYEDPPGCKPLKNCGDVICNVETENRIFDYSPEGCRKCICVPR